MRGYPSLPPEGRQGGAEQQAAGGGGSQCHQVGETAPKNRAVERWVGVKTPDRAADGVGDTDETATRQATASPPRAAAAAGRRRLAAPHALPSG